MSWNIAYVTRVVDQESPLHATQVSWIRALATDGRVGSVRVLTAKKGRTDLPDNVAVREFGPGWPGFLKFTLLSSMLRNKIDWFFIAQGGPFPALLLPVKSLGGPFVFQWKAHAIVSRRMEFYARFCDDLVFTSADASLPLKHTSDSKRVVGQGIDCTSFTIPDQLYPTRSLIHVGRVTPIKGIEVVIRILAYLADHRKERYTLDLVGPVEEAYKCELQSLAREYGVEDLVRFIGPKPHYLLPDIIPRYRAAVNMSSGAMDKGALECLACGVPVLTSNLPLLESLPPHITEYLRIDQDRIPLAAESLLRILQLSDNDRRSLQATLRSAVVADHSLDTFFVKILDEIEQFIAAR